MRRPLPVLYYRQFDKLLGHVHHRVDQYKAVMEYDQFDLKSSIHHQEIAIQTTHHVLQAWLFDTDHAHLAIVRHLLWVI